MVKGATASVERTISTMGNPLPTHITIAGAKNFGRVKFQFSYTIYRLLHLSVFQKILALVVVGCNLLTSSMVIDFFDDLILQAMAVMPLRFCNLGCT